MLFEVVLLVKMPAVEFFFQLIADLLVILIGPEIIGVFLFPCVFVLFLSIIIQFEAPKIWDIDFIGSAHVSL